MEHIDLTFVDQLAGMVLKGAREQQGLTQQQLADHVGQLGMTMSRVMITNSELGKRSLAIRELYVLAVALETTLGDLVREFEKLDTALVDIDDAIQRARELAQRERAMDRDLATARQWRQDALEVLRQRADELTPEQRAEFGIE